MKAGCTVNYLKQLELFTITNHIKRKFQAFSQEVSTFISSQLAHTVQRFLFKCHRRKRLVTIKGFGKLNVYKT